MLDLKTLLDEAPLTLDEMRVAVKEWAPLESDPEYGDINSFDKFLDNVRAKKAFRVLLTAMGPLLRDAEGWTPVSLGRLEDELGIEAKREVL